MRIYTMTATFGKLEHEKLTFQPGLNVIQAPNEWGKSTWCAFLIAMLYGIDTRERTTKELLADKERYAPWSGSPLSGRIDLNWNGRDITIERKSRGRAIFGDFRAYETQSGLAVPELTATNCGQMLLGVERSVFVRAGFLRFRDLPVTQDETLRRRLNALVTTGDESGAGDVLAQKLRDLKNHCRWGRSGLLPQAEKERGILEEKLNDLEALEAQAKLLEARQKELEAEIEALQNHRQALLYEAAQKDAKRVEQARAAAEAAQIRQAELENRCQSLPPREQAQKTLTELEILRQRRLEAGSEPEQLPPTAPQIPAFFQNLTQSQAEADRDLWEALSQRRKSAAAWLLALGALLVLIGGVLSVLRWLVIGAASAVAGVVLAVAGGILLSRFRQREAVHREKAAALERKYAPYPPDQWVAQAAYFAQLEAEYRKDLAQYQAAQRQRQQNLQGLKRRMLELSQGEPVSSYLDYLRRSLGLWTELEQARTEARHTTAYRDDLQAVVKPAEKPAQPDTLTFSPRETEVLIVTKTGELGQLRLRLGQSLGKIENLGQKARLHQQLEAANGRIGKLEQVYAAAEIAQSTLAEAKAELQRRFAPRITKRTQELFTQLTRGRYDRLALEQDFSVRTGTAEEDTLHGVRWRSDGTVDQLYLALRLAVAEELTPEAPLILDDALVRFDGERLAAAMDILKEEAGKKQVIIFTCQDREKAYMN